jgi:uncharacterized protein YndB with AHSA1/START domain
MKDNNETAVIHATFAIERTYPAAPARVFRAFADQGTKRRWFAEGAGFEVQDFTLDFRVGGREVAAFRFQGNAPPGGPAAGAIITNETTYQDIVPARRIVFAYTMTIDGKRISASLATVELTREGDGTRLLFTEQAAFFDGGDGAKMREQGWVGLLAQLGEALTRGAS